MVNGAKKKKETVLRLVNAVSHKKKRNDGNVGRSTP